MYTIEQLSSGDGEPILVIDFLSPMSETRLSSKIVGLGTDHTVYRIDPVSDISLLGYRGVEELTTGYAEPWGRISETRSTLIVAYCTTAPLGLQMAARLQKDGGAACLLVDPSWPDSNMLTSEYAEMRSKWQVDAPGEPLPALRGKQLYDHLEEAVRSDLVSYLVKQGLTTENANRHGAELIARCMGWLGFLLAMSDLRLDQDPAAAEMSRFAGTPGIPVVEVRDGSGHAFRAEMSHGIDTLIESMRTHQS